MSPLSTRAAAHRPEPAGPDRAIRVAADNDAARLATARIAFFQTQIAAGWLDRPADLDDWVMQGTSAIIRGPRNCVLLAESGSALAGYVFGTTKIVPGAAMPLVASIEEIYVATDHRGAGLARRLFDSAQAAFKAKGADRIQLRILAGNAAGRTFWSGLGFRETAILCELEQEPCD